MKHIFLLVLIFIVIIVGGYLFLPAFDQETNTKEIVLEPFKQEGCLGLNYHRVRKSHWYTKVIELLFESDELKTYNIYQKEFRSQIEQLKELGATFISEKELMQARETNDFPDKCVWISFDDIDKTVYDNAFPILKEHNIPVTLFVIAGQVEKVFSNMTMVTWEELQEMVDSGLVKIGSHSYDMHYLDETNKPVFASDQQKDAFAEDLQKSIETLEKNLGVSVTSYAYPFGFSYSHLQPILEKSHIDYAFVLQAEPMTNRENNMAINRIMVTERIFDKQILPWMKE